MYFYLKIKGTYTYVIFVSTFRVLNFVGPLSLKGRTSYVAIYIQYMQYASIYCYTNQY